MNVIVCQQDYCESDEPISLKLDVMVGPNSGKNRLTFSGDPASYTDSGLLFHFPPDCRLWQFSRFISIFQ